MQTVIFSCFREYNPAPMDSAVSHRISTRPLVITTVRISLEEIRPLEKSISVCPMEKKKSAPNFLVNMCKIRYVGYK